jgi:hypothetical protein
LLIEVGTDKPPRFFDPERQPIREDIMEVTYIGWAVLGVFFFIALSRLRSKESKTLRRDESARVSVFRPGPASTTKRFL